jgi:predicted SnoaL-like aldol condensation-catalyzing enzyme
MVAFRKPTTDLRLLEVAERIHHAWNAALEAKDVEGAVRLYAENATIESPLIRYLLRTDIGVLSGRDEIRRFLPIVFKNQPSERRTFRNDVFTDGTIMMWEYPRKTPGADQMDFAEVMELKDGLIQNHRVYWGWFGVRTLTSESHGR